MGLASRSELLCLLVIVPSSVDAALDYVNGVIVGLNALYGIRAPVRSRRRHAAQSEALRQIVSAAAGLQQRLAAAFADRLVGGWDHFEAGATAPRTELSAVAVDVPACAGTCDPRRLLPSSAARRISNVSSVFPSPPNGLNRFSSFYAGSRAEYILLTARQLRAAVAAGLPWWRHGLPGA